jgi:hypothetical protein
MSGLTALTWLLVLVGCARTGPAPAPGAEAAVEQDPLEVWTDELVPLVEKHGARRFREPPVVERLTPTTLGELVREESRLISDALYRDTPEEVRRTRAAAEGDVSMRGLFGKYGVFTRKVYLVEETVRAAADDTGLPMADLARVVLAHELAHALQGEQVDNTTLFDRLVDQDHFHGWASVSEGGANVIARRVAEELGLTEAFWAMSRKQGWDQSGLLEPGAYDIWMRYGRGMDALQAVVDAEGMDGFWRWHEAPPASSRALFRPRLYEAEPSTRNMDYAAVLRGVDQVLTRGAWLVTNSRLGEYVLRGEAIRTGKEEAFDAVLEELVDAQILDLTLPDRTGDVRYLQFARPEAARRYLELLRAEQTVEGQILAARLGVTVEVTYGAVPDVAGDASLLRTQRVPTGGGRFLETRTAWVVRGADVVAVNAHRFRPGLRLARTVNAVFENLERVRAGQDR